VPTRNLRSAGITATVALVYLLGACSDDGADTGSASGSGSGSGSASGSGSGLGSEDLSGTTDDEAILGAVDEYRRYVQNEVAILVDATTTFTDAVRAGNMDAAKSAYAPSRYHWETIEPIAGLIAEIDGAVDARVDDFADETDPAWTGWHRIEYLLWVQGDTATAVHRVHRVDLFLRRDPG
jgi:iron uptake system component EfeO